MAGEEGYQGFSISIAIAKRTKGKQEFLLMQEISYAGKVFESSLCFLILVPERAKLTCWHPEKGGYAAWFNFTMQSYIEYFLKLSKHESIGINKARVLSSLLLLLECFLRRKYKVLLISLSIN